MFHTRRGLGNLGLALVFAGSAGCGQSNQAKPINFTANGFDGFEDTRFDILSSTCSFDGSSNMIVNLVAGETGYLFLRASDSYIVANAAQSDGSECKILASTLTGTTPKKIFVRGADGANNQKLIVDFYNGLWAQATTASATIATTDNSIVQVNFSYNVTPASESVSGTGNEIKFRGTANADNFAFSTPSGQTSGQEGRWYSYLSAATGTTTTSTVAQRGANFSDVSIKHANYVKVSTGPGNDIITPLGLGGTVTTAASALRGAINFYAWGGDDDDVLYTGAASTGGAANYFFGGAGNDKIIQSSFCSKDIIDGGGGTADLVDYSAKTAKLKITVGSENGVTAGTAASGSLTCATKANLVQNEKFTLKDGTHTKVFEFKKTANAAAVGSITVVAFGQVALGDQFSLSDGVTTNTFKFDTDGTLPAQTPPNYAIDVHTTTPTANSDIVDAMKTAVDGATMNFTTTKTGGGATLTITNNTASSAGNYTIAKTFTNNGSFATVVNLAGGTSVWTATAGTTTIDVTATTTADDVCSAVAGAINGIVGGLTVTATGTTSPLALANDAVGTIGNTISDDTVVHASFVLTDLYGGVNAYVLAEDDGDITCNSNAGEGDSILQSVEHVIGGTADDIIDASNGGGASHILVGLAGNDILIGDSGADTLYGGLGNDTLKGGGGKDTLYGGDGDDILQPGDVSGDLVYGGTVAAAENCPASMLPSTAGTNCTNVAASGVNTLDFSDRPWGTGVTCNLTEVCTVTSGVLQANAATCGTTSGTQHVSWVNISNLTGGAGNDILLGDNNANSIHGGSGNDTISGMGGNDTLYGDSGDDTIYGGNAGATALPAGCTSACTTDNDFISGGLGLDSLYGGLGNDFIDANDGDPDLVIDCGGTNCPS